ncbi:hypothetical protein FLACOL7796_00954 [Flavobacterium collinsii]|uniref:Uncharacterized protein n=1 Tax=Flavobacterium collinsii TaxID=1114861 RepID=A0ABM8KFD0_9FLAO|nr:hypothetical protein FLACOL7796_00954 [Flavobacterium collinsii]
MQYDEGRKIKIDLGGFVDMQNNQQILQKNEKKFYKINR